MHFCFLVGAMYHCAILYVYFVANADGVYITTDHGIEPYTAIVTHYYIAYYSGIFSQETIIAKHGLDTFYGFN
jgi:hypothetical protein